MVTEQPKHYLPQDIDRVIFDPYTLDMEEQYMQLVTEFIGYNPNTGRFTWLRGNGFKARGSEARGQGTYINLKGKRYNAAKVAWYLQTGSWPDKRVMFNNGNAQDYRWKNLSNGQAKGVRLNVAKIEGEFYIDGQRVESAAEVLEAVWSALS